MAHAGGRPTKYKPEYCEKIIEYFNVQPQQVVYKRTYHSDGKLKSEEPIVLPQQFPTFQGFAHEIDVDMNTLTGWRENIKEFSVAYSRAKALQEKIWLVNSVGNLYNSQFAQFFGKNCLGYKDKTETELSGSVNNPLAGMTADDLRKLVNDAADSKPVE
jgi:hypothetical protein